MPAMYWALYCILFIRLKIICSVPALELMQLVKWNCLN